MSAAGTYQLGVDLGTTWTAAATARDGTCEMVGLGNRSVAIPSVVHQAYDGTTLTGDAADRRGPSEPLRVAREFKRRIGDPTPILLGGTPYAAEALLGTLLAAVVERVSQLEGGPPGLLTATHPANWGSYKIGLFEQAVQMAGVTASTTLTEPEAAAVAYAANERVETGALIAVYDLGGGTFDTAILRKTADGFALLGRPAGIDRLGGIDFDEAVIGHVRATLGTALDGIDPTDPATLKAMARLRRECIEAKEALSTDTQVTIPVLLPGVQSEVRLNRSEFEAMIRPTLDATTAALRRTMTAAAVDPHDISTVLLVGGSSRIPLVAELVSEAFDRPVAVDAHPKHAIALGAARAASLAEAVTPHAGDARVIPFAVDARTAPGGARHDTMRDGEALWTAQGSTAHDVDETIDLSSAVFRGNTSRGTNSARRDRASTGPVDPAHGRDTRATASVRIGGDRRPARGRRLTHRAVHEFGRMSPGGRGGGAGAVDHQPRLVADADPYDLPEEVPDWLAEARDAHPGRSRRRWLAGVVAFVVLSVMAIGAGAIVASEPRAEAYDGSAPGVDADRTGSWTTGATDTTGAAASDDTGGGDERGNAGPGGDGGATLADGQPGSQSGDGAAASPDTAGEATKTNRTTGREPAPSGDPGPRTEPDGTASPTDPTPTPEPDPTPPSEDDPTPPSEPAPSEGATSEPPTDGGAASEPPADTGAAPSGTDAGSPGPSEPPARSVAPAR